MADDNTNGITNDAPQAPPLSTTDSAQTKTKRSRVQFSCTACRYRKLKCDRTHPCDRCTKRGDAASCTYVGHGPRGRANHATAANPSHIQNRIQHLENLILSFAQQKKQEDGGPSGGTSSSATTAANSNAATEPSPATSDSAAQSPAINVDPGKIQNDEQLGTTYIDSSHWQAILDDLKEVKKYVQVEGQEDEGLDDGAFLEDDSEDEMVEVERDANRPTLLFYGGSVPSKQELLADLPDRSTVDRLIAKFLNSDDPTLVIVHFPTFHKEYNQFWNDPTRVSLPWLAFLYGCMTMAVGMFGRSMEKLPASLGDPAHEIDRFQKNCCYCLIGSNYTTVGKYKVEALLVYATIEYTKRGNSAMSVQTILGMTIKLAMRMGYHRDASHYDSISALQGEMRRRTWAIIGQLDTLTSFQVGIPKQTQNWQSDTTLPRNINDEDFDENSIELPPSQPDSVRTPVTYLRSKNRIMKTFGQISDLAYSCHPVTYEKVLELDHALEQAHDLMAPSLRMRPMNQSFADHPALIMKRYTLDVLYQKARIVLHRRYLVEARYNQRVSYSRSVCVNAAKEVLRHQYDLFQESQVGGRLEKNNWFFRSLQHHDFVLAAMVICLELFKNDDTSSTLDSNSEQQHDGRYSAANLEERDRLIEALKKSREVWKESAKYSVDARKAFYAVTIMLKKAEIDNEARRSSQSPLQQTDHLQYPANMQSSISVGLSGTPGRSPDDIAIGESASSGRLRAAEGQDVYMDNFLPPNIPVNIPTPPMSNSSGQAMEGHNIATTDSTGTDNGLTDSINDTSIQEREALVPSLDAFQQQYPDLQSALPGLDVIETMLDTPQNLDWHAWDGGMQDNGPIIWDDYWIPADGTATGNTMQIDNLGGNQMMNTQRQQTQQQPQPRSNGSGNGNKPGSQKYKMSDLYFAAGYKG